MPPPREQPLEHDDMEHVLARYQAHTITLQECYRLRRWLYAVKLGPHAPETEQKLVAFQVINALNGLIYDLEHQEKDAR